MSEIKHESYLYKMLLNGKGWISNLWEGEKEISNLQRTREERNETILERDTPGQIVGINWSFWYLIKMSVHYLDNQH